MADCKTCSQESSCSKKSCAIEETKNPLSNVKKVIAVMSGKGGVGKSSVTSLLAVTLQRKGYKVGILDGDIIGPSIPKIFGVSQKPVSSTNGLIPPYSKSGIPLMSINLLLEEETKPVIWRGPVISGTVKQFWTDVIWDDLDFLLIDLPPGTGDIPLTVMQILPVEGVVIVTSPQDLVGMVVEKSLHMAQMMNKPIVGMIENMSYFICDNCDQKHFIFGQGKVQETARKFNIPYLGALPIDPNLPQYEDQGNIESYQSTAFETITEQFLSIIQK